MMGMSANNHFFICTGHHAWYVELSFNIFIIIYSYNYWDQKTLAQKVDTEKDKLFYLDLIIILSITLFSLSERAADKQIVIR